MGLLVIEKIWFFLMKIWKCNILLSIQVKIEIKKIWSIVASMIFNHLFSLLLIHLQLHVLVLHLIISFVWKSNYK